MKRRRINRRVLLGATIVLLAAGQHGGVQGQETRPNFVILFADDLGYGDLGCFGHPTIRTPNLDRMAREGLRLTSFYALPSCSPSRAALLTGRYPPRTGVSRVLGPDSKNGIRAEEVTIAEALKPLGYRTAAVGKWHLGHAEARFRPLANGFDRYFGLLYSNDMIRPWVQTDAPLRLWRDDEIVEEYPVDQSTLTERYTEEALDFIRDAKEEPFFLYLAYSMVHLPISVSSDFAGRSRAGLYGDAVERIDWSVGRILDELKARGLDERTLVVFTSDNGPWLDLPDRMLAGGVEPWHAGSPGLLRGWKGSTYEGGVRVPFVARWPGRIPAGRDSADLASTLDLFPTLAAMAGAQAPRDRAIDGLDLTKFFEGEVPSPREFFYYVRGGRVEGVRDGVWKLRISNHLRPDSERAQPPTPELFNLEVDPSERYNLARKHPEIVRRMTELLERGRLELVEPNKDRDARDTD